jgi:hypothetical protein
LAHGQIACLSFHVFPVACAGNSPRWRIAISIYIILFHSGHLWTSLDLLAWGLIRDIKTGRAKTCDETPLHMMK